VRPRHRRPAASSSEEGKFVPQHDDFQVFALVRPNAQDRQLQDPPNRGVTEREEHEPSEAAILCIRLGLAPPRRGGWPERDWPERETRFLHPSPAFVRKVPSSSTKPHKASIPLTLPASRLSRKMSRSFTMMSGPDRHDRVCLGRNGAALWMTPT